MINSIDTELLFHIIKFVSDDKSGNEDAVTRARNFLEASVTIYCYRMPENSLQYQVLHAALKDPELNIALRNAAPAALDSDSISIIFNEAVKRSYNNHIAQIFGADDDMTKNMGFHLIHSLDLVWDEHEEEHFTGRHLKAYLEAIIDSLQIKLEKNNPRSIALRTAFKEVSKNHDSMRLFDKRTSYEGQGEVLAVAENFMAAVAKRYHELKLTVIEKPSQHGGMWKSVDDDKKQVHLPPARPAKK